MAKPEEIQKQVRALYDTLSKKAENDSFKTEEGRELYKLMSEGSLTGPQLGLFLQGASLATSDELIGYTRAFFNDSYGTAAAAMNQAQPGLDATAQDVAIELERQPMRQYREENPLKAFGLEAAGGMTMGGVGAYRAAGTTLGREALKAGGYGAVSGFAGAEGDVSDRAPSAVGGGATSLALQPFADIATKSLGGAVSNFLRGDKGISKDAKQQAQRMLLEAIKADGMEVDEALAFIANNAGKNVTLADIGSNTQSLMDAVSVLPGPGKETALRYLRNRMQGRNARLGTLMQDAFGQKANFYNDFQALKAARKGSADKLYGEANKINVPMSDDLRAILRTPAGQNAFEQGMRIANNKGQSIKLSITPDGRIVDKDMNPVVDINTRFLHFIKMGLDDVAFPNMPKQGIGAEEVRSVRDVRNDFINLLDNANPAYKRARNVYSSDSAVMKAMQNGREINRRDPDELAAELQNMGNIEREAFSLGALQNLQDQADLSVDGANMAYNMMKTERRRKLLRLAFPEGEAGQKKFDEYMQGLRLESQMSGTEQAARNSRTAERSELIGQMRREVDQTTDLNLNPTQILFNQLRDSGVQAGDEQLRRASGELSQMLTATDPQTVQRILADIQPMGLVESVRKHAPSLLRNMLPVLRSLATGPFVVGGQTGMAAANVLSQPQAELMAQ